MSRRLLFLHYILTQKKDSMLSKFFHAQSDNPKKGDWCQTVLSDLNMLGLSSYTYENISSISKTQFRKIVKEAIQHNAFAYVNKEKDKLSKVCHLKFTELVMQDYLLPTSNLTLDESRFMFLAQSRMLPVGVNFRGTPHSSLSGTPNVDPVCPVCLDPSTQDCQRHLMGCHKLVSSDLVQSIVQYDDLFSTELSKKISVMRVLKLNLER